MITLEEFKKQVGGRHAVVMDPPEDTTHMGVPYKKGKGSLFITQVAYALYKQGWIAKDHMITEEEAQALNAHFKAENELETGKVKTVKTKN